MSALAITTAPRTRLPEQQFCSCGEPLDTPRERRNDQCCECERFDERMVCVVREEYVGMAYCDGRPTFCSDGCEEAYWDCPA
jgi:hypothetical protein